MEYSDEDLLLAIQSNDQQLRNAALKQLYLDLTINLKVREFATTYGGNNTSPDDILQEGIILLDELIRSGKFRGNSKVKTFLLGICKNIARSGNRKLNRIVLKDNWQDGEEVGLESSPEELVLVEEKSDMANQRDEILKQLMAQLTDKCKQVLHLYYFLSYNMAKVAEARGLKNANQAKKAASRCREQLKKMIKEQPSLAQFLKQSL